MVRDRVLAFKDWEQTLARDTKNAFVASAAASTNTLSLLATGMVDMLRTGANKFEETTLHHCCNLLKITKRKSSDAMRSTPIISLLQDMVEQRALVEAYRDKVRELKCEMGNKDAVIEQLKSLITNKNANQYVPDIAIKVASFIENANEDCTVLCCGHTRARTFAWACLLVTSTKRVLKIYSSSGRSHLWYHCLLVW